MQKRLPFTVIMVLEDFAKDQAVNYFEDVVPSLTDEEKLDLYSNLIGNSTYFKDNLNSLIPVSLINEVLVDAFKRLRKEPMEWWDQIITVLKHYFSETLIKKLRPLIKEMEDSRKMSMAQVIESLLLNSDE